MSAELFVAVPLLPEVRALVASRRDAAFNLTGRTMGIAEIAEASAGARILIVSPANRMDEAITEFRQACQLRPSEASPLVELATAYLAVGRTDDGVATLDLALERQPDHPTALATLAFVDISKNDEAGARRRWEQIRRQPKTPPEVVQSLRQAFAQQFGRQLP